MTKIVKIGDIFCGCYFHYFGGTAYRLPVENFELPNCQRSVSDSLASHILYYTLYRLFVKGFFIFLWDYFKSFLNRRKSLYSKDLRRGGPAPLALSRYRVKSYVNRL